MLENINDIIQAIGVISAIIFSTISIIISYRDKVEARKPILYIFPQENTKAYDSEEKVHFFGEFGIKLGIHIINIGGGLAKNIKLSWNYQGNTIENKLIQYLCATDERIGRAKVDLPTCYVTMIQTLIAVKSNNDIENLLDDLDDLELKLTFLDAGKVKYKEKYIVRVIPHAAYCMDDNNSECFVQKIHLMVQIEEV